MKQRFIAFVRIFVFEICGARTRLASERPCGSKNIGLTALRSSLPRRVCCRLVKNLRDQMLLPVQGNLVRHGALAGGVVTVFEDSQKRSQKVTYVALVCRFVNIFQATDLC